MEGLEVVGCLLFLGGQLGPVLFLGVLELFLEGLEGVVETEEFFFVAVGGGGLALLEFV